MFKRSERQVRKQIKDMQVLYGGLGGYEEVNNHPRIKNDPQLMDELRALLIEHKFRKLRSWNDEEGPTRYSREIDAHAYIRHDFVVQLFLPWIWQVFDLEGATVVEIGSGTGSASAAFARYVGSVHGYDISDADLDVARQRSDLMGLTNVMFYSFEPRKIIDAIVQKHSSQKVDVLLLFAVLEHQTIAERLELLSAIPHFVRPGGIVVVCETPNRLAPVDYHSSQLPYFNSLPIELRQIFGPKSPRKDFTSIFDDTSDPYELELRLNRFGSGVSFHEFEIGFPWIHDSIIADGFHPNIQRVRGRRVEDVFTEMTMERVTPWVHRAFSLHYLDFVFRVGKA